MRNSLYEFRDKVKDSICDTLTDIYLSQNDGLYPKWDEDEKIIVEENEVVKIDYIITNSFDDHKEIETLTIDRYIVTLDKCLYFDIGGENLSWTEIPIENLIDIWERVNELYLDM